MPAAGTWNLGSVQDEIYNLSTETIPTSMSGTSLNNLIDRKLDYMNQFLGITVANTAIILKYQDPLISLSMADLLDHIEGVSAGQNKKIKIGEMSISKSASSGGVSSTLQWKTKGIEALNELKDKASFYKAYG